MTGRAVRLMMLLVALGTTSSACCQLSSYRAREWLTAKQGEAKVELSGQWEAGPIFDGGWGFGMLFQEGSQLWGTLGLFKVRGVLNGTTAFLALLSDEGCAQYTGYVSIREDGSLLGMVKKDALFDDRPENKKPLVLRRLTR